MKMLVFAVAIFICFSFSSCKGKNKESKKAAADTTRFYPVTESIQADIKDVNQTPYFIYNKETVNGKADSTPINTTEFNQLASRFLKPDINDEKLKPYYKEDIFADQTTQSITFNYTTLDKALEIQNVALLLDESGQKVKRIFMRKHFAYEDSTAIEQLTWKPHESFEISRAVMHDSSETRRQIIVVWNTRSK